VLFACRNSFAGIMRQLGDSESDLTLLQWAWADAVFKYHPRLKDQFGRIPMDAIERHCTYVQERGAQRSPPQPQSSVSVIKTFEHHENTREPLHFPRC
jgi:endo-alpha-1,4-polygalactosaminidase (GH114 family)